MNAAPRQRSGRDQTRFEIAAAIARYRLAEHEARVAALLTPNPEIPPDVAKDLRKQLRLPSEVWPKGNSGDR